MMYLAGLQRPGISQAQKQRMAEMTEMAVKRLIHRTNQN